MVEVTAVAGEVVTLTKFMDLFTKCNITWPHLTGMYVNTIVG